jgi:hypothetical protein
MHREHTWGCANRTPTTSSRSAAHAHPPRRMLREHTWGHVRSPTPTTSSLAPPHGSPRMQSRRWERRPRHPRRRSQLQPSGSVRAATTAPPNASVRPASSAPSVRAPPWCARRVSRLPHTGGFRDRVAFVRRSEDRLLNYLILPYNCLISARRRVARNCVIGRHETDENEPKRRETVRNRSKTNESLRLLGVRNHPIRGPSKPPIDPRHAHPPDGAARPSTTSIHSFQGYSKQPVQIPNLCLISAPHAPY